MARKIAWGIDIGQTALRAVKAMPVGDRIEILAFDSVEYDEILSAPDVDKDGAIQQALRTFLSRNHIARGDLVLGCIPGQSALIRFIKLPPVEKKRVPDIVRYEAHQQIPFPLEEVVWDYKPLEKVYGPGEQVEVGIFAMRRDIVHGFLSNLMVCNLDEDALQLAPMALYNYVAFDQPVGPEAQIVIDMGAENTELLIYTGNSVWPRSLPVSGNDFTEAIMAKFKVPFGKAETLKRMAKQSKYSTQIYQALEPVLRRLVEEVQRSIGYYKSINPGTRIGGLMALGGSFKLPGLAKYLSENLHLPIRMLNEPQNFDMSMARNPRVFEENALSFGVALGLAVQGCGMARMDISLLPQEILQRKIIARKKPWAAAVAACALLMFATAWYATWQRTKELNEAASQKVNDKTARDFIEVADAQKRKYNELTNVTSIQTKLDEVKKLWVGRDFWLHALRKVYAPVQPEPENEKGVWYKMVVSETVEFDTAAAALADNATKTMESGLGFKATKMELQAGFMEKLKSSIRRPEYTEVGATGAPVMGSRLRTPADAKTHNPDVVYMVIQGDTIDPRGGEYVTESLVGKLTNVWKCPNEKCGFEVEGLTPPEKCADPFHVNCKTAAKDFLLQNPPLIVDVRFKGSVRQERFVDHLDRVIPSTSLGDEEQKIWTAILSREADQKAGKIASWAAGDREGEAPLPPRRIFLVKLEQDHGIRLENFTDFEIAFFFDPSGKLLNTVSDMQKKAAETASKRGVPRNP